MEHDRHARSRPPPAPPTSRHIDNGRGRHNIRHVGLFLWRLQAYPLTGVDALAVDDRRFLVDPLGLDRRLFAEPVAETAVASLAGPEHVPHPITRLELHRHVTGIEIAVDGVPQPDSAICSCDLSDAGAGWAHPAPAGKIAVDPVLGRVAFADPPGGAVTVGYATGFPGDLGGGPYDRRAALAPFLAAGVTWQLGVAAEPPPDEPRVVATLAEAVTAWNAQPPGTRGVIVLMGSGTLAEDVGIEVPEGSHLLVAAGQWPEEPTGDALDPMGRRTGRVVPRGVRPHLRGTVEVTGTAPADSVSPGFAHPRRPADRRGARSRRRPARRAAPVALHAGTRGRGAHDRRQPGGSTCRSSAPSPATSRPAAPSPV